MKPKPIIFSLILIAALAAGDLFSAEVDILGDRRGVIKKRELFIKITLTDAAGKPGPSNEAVYGSDKLFFSISPVGEWEFDSGYLERLLPSMSFVQLNKVCRIQQQTPILEEDKIAWVLIQIPRIFDLTQPFTISIQLKGVEGEAQMQLPEQLWPDYTLLQSEFNLANMAKEANNPAVAFEKLTKMSENPNLPRLSFYKDVTEIRKKIFNDYFQAILSDFTRIRLDTTITTDTKLSSLNQLMTRFDVLLDTMRFDSLAQTPDAASLKEMRATAKNNRDQLRDFINNTSQAYDMSLVDWMETAGAHDYRLWLMVKSVYAIFKGQRIGGEWNINVDIPDSITQKLEMVNLSKNLAAMKRIIECNRAKGGNLLPDRMIRNLRGFVGAFNNEKANVTQPYVEAVLMADFFFKGKLDSTVVYLDKAIAASCDLDMNEWLSQIEALVKPGKVVDPQPVKELSEEGRRLLENGDLEGAMEKFQHVELMAPNSPINLYHLGLYNLLKKDTLKAITYFEKAIAADSSLSIVYRKLGGLYISGKQWEKAATLFDKAKRSSNTWEFNYFLAVSHYQLGDYLKAIESLQQAVNLNGKNYFQYILFGDVYQKSGNAAGAKLQYDHARQLEPDRPEAYERINALEGGGE